MTWWRDVICSASTIEGGPPIERGAPPIERGVHQLRGGTPPIERGAPPFERRPPPFESRYIVLHTNYVDFYKDWRILSCEETQGGADAPPWTPPPVVITPVSLGKYQSRPLKQDWVIMHHRVVTHACSGLIR